MPHPITKQVITDKNIESCKIQLLNSQFGGMLGSTFVKTHLASSNVLASHKIADICKAPMIYCSFQYELFVYH